LGSGNERFTGLPFADPPLTAHADAVISVSFSADGKRVVSGSQDRTVKVWDAQTGQETLTLKGHSEPVWSVSFSPDGKRIVSGSLDDTLKVWDISSLDTSKW
jgi:WD40 repeat protein